MRVFLETEGRWAASPRLAGVSWVDTGLGLDTCEIRYAEDVGIDPERALIVPSFRQDLDVPVYGPYDLTALRYDSPNGSFQTGRLAHDFSQVFASGDEAALRRLGDQVNALATAGHEPFRGWTTLRQADDPPHVAKLGPGYIEQASSLLWSVGDIQEADNVLADFGLKTRLRETWSSAAGWTPSLVVIPKHQVMTNVAAASAVATLWGIRPPVNVATSWVVGVPIAFRQDTATNRLDLPQGDYCAWLQRPTGGIVDLYNSVRAPHSTWETRRITVGYRGLGFVDEVVFHTGTATTPAIFLDPLVGGGLTAKFAEELRRWDLQNTAAVWNGTRQVADEWTALDQVVLTPDQIVDIPADLLWEGWPDDKRAFTIRTVRHSFTPQAGYTQQVEASIWQGAFRRLAAVTGT